MRRSRRGHGGMGCTRGSAKVQIGAELLCKSAKVSLGVGTGVGVGKLFQMSRGRDVIAITSALTPDGCDVIASLPVAPAGAWSRRLKAERLIPEWLMPRWPSPGTLKRMAAANFPVSGLPLSETDAMSSHPYPRPSLHRYSILDTQYSHARFAPLHRPQAGCTFAPASHQTIPA